MVAMEQKMNHICLLVLRVIGHYTGQFALWMWSFDVNFPTKIYSWWLVEAVTDHGDATIRAITLLSKSLSWKNIYYCKNPILKLPTKL